MRLIDADAYAAEMRKRQNACMDWLTATEDGSEMNIRAEQAMVTFIEASLTLENQPTIPAITPDWLREKMDGYAAKLKSTELAALVTVMQMWEQEER